MNHNNLQNTIMDSSMYICIQSRNKLLPSLMGKQKRGLYKEMEDSNWILPIIIFIHFTYGSWSQWYTFYLGKANPRLKNQ